MRKYVEPNPDYKMPDPDPIDNEQLLRQNAEYFEQLYYKADAENRELKKGVTWKKTAMLITMTVYSFVVTMFEALNNPYFVKDIKEFFVGMKNAFVWLFQKALSGSAFVNDVTGNIPILSSIIVAVFVVGIYLLLFGVVFFIYAQYSVAGISLKDYKTAMFVLCSLAFVIFFGESIKRYVNVNLILLFIILNVAFIIIRNGRVYVRKIGHWG